MGMTKKRIEGIRFHIANNDYFGTLATVLDLTRQTLGKSAREQGIAATLEALTKDLLYLQGSYDIKPKPANDEPGSFQNGSRL